MHAFRLFQHLKIETIILESSGPLFQDPIYSSNRTKPEGIQINAVFLLKKKNQKPPKQL